LSPNPDPDPDPEFKAKYGSGSRVLMTNNRKNLQLENIFNFYDQKIAIYLSLGLNKGRPSYRRSLQPSKENIKHFRT
jgi:hypothetical protein